MIKRTSFMVAAGLLALAPSLASAYTGVLINCTGGAPVSTVVTIKPGLDCTDRINSIAVEASLKNANQITGCVSNPLAPWGTWVLNKWLKQNPLASGVNAADLKVKASTFGSCNFAGGPTSGKAWGTGQVFFYAAGAKIPGGPAKFAGRVAGDLGTQSAQVVGIVTKGLVQGGTIVAQVPIDVANPINGAVLGCNTVPGFCTPDPFGNTGTNPSSKCTAAGVPYACCTGAATGTCISPANQLALFVGGTGFLRISYDDNADCTGASTPYLCCTGVGTGTCN